MRHKDKEIPIPRALEEVGPVKRVWVIAQAMPGAPRHEVLTACRNLGINERTAATQYQLWHYSREQARKARALPKGVRRKIERAAEMTL